MTLEQSLSYDFRQPELLKQALTHRSYHNENPSLSIGHNERLEFLGDAVLDLIVSEKLFSTRPDAEEGELSKLRASLVNESVLCEVAREMNLGRFMKLGRGEEVTQGFDKPRLLASTFEALVGAIYLDGGFSEATKFILGHLETRLHSEDSNTELLADFKTRLQEKTQSLLKKTPHYELLGEEGPDHEKTFKVCVKLADDILGEGIGRSKKLAEQSAAAAALERLQSLRITSTGDK